MIEMHLYVDKSPDNSTIKNALTRIKCNNSRQEITWRGDGDLDMDFGLHIKLYIMINHD